MIGNSSNTMMLTLPTTLAAATAPRSLIIVHSSARHWKEIAWMLLSTARLWPTPLITMRTRLATTLRLSCLQSLVAFFWSAAALPAAALTAESRATLTIETSSWDNLRKAADVPLSESLNNCFRTRSPLNSAYFSFFLSISRWLSSSER